MTRVPAQAWVVLSFLVYVTVAALFFWPGQIDPDTLDEISEAATGHFVDFHTPLLSALFRGPYLLGMTSPGWILVASLFTMLVGFNLILRCPVPSCPRNRSGHGVLHVAPGAVVGRACRA